MNDKEFIKAFQKISVKKICEGLKINYFNINSGKAGYNVTKTIAKELENKINEIMEKRTNYIEID